MAYTAHPAHKALQIHEILAQIFNELYPADRWPVTSRYSAWDVQRELYRTGRQTVYNASLVCSTWLGPALDILWAELPDMQPLFHVFWKLCEEYRWDDIPSTVRIYSWD